MPPRLVGCFASFVVLAGCNEIPPQVGDADSRDAAALADGHGADAGGSDAVVHRDAQSGFDARTDAMSVADSSRALDAQLPDSSQLDSGRRDDASHVDAGPVATQPEFALSEARSLTTRPGGTASGFGFGSSLALSPDDQTLAVGDMYSGGNAGVVHLYMRASPDGSFASTPEQRLYGPTGSRGFGVAVAFSRDGLSLAVGDSGYGSGRLGPGAVHLFTRATTGTAFALAPTQTLTGLSLSENFGRALAFAPDDLSLAVGLVQRTGEARGAVRVFTRGSTGGMFDGQPSQTIVADTLATSFGLAVLFLDQQTLVIAERASDPAFGAVHFYERQDRVEFGATPAYSIRGTEPYTYFATSIAASRDGLTLVVGDYVFSDTRRPLAVFARNSAQERFTEPFQNIRGQLGSAVAMRSDGNEIFATDFAATTGSGPGAGVVFAFVR